MNSIQLNPSCTNKESDKFLGKFLSKEYYDLLIEEDCLVLKEDGSPLLILKKNCLTKPNVARFYGSIKKAIKPSSNRGTASGGQRFNKVKQDGTVSKTNHSAPVMSSVIGFLERYPRIPYCRMTAFTQNNPKEWAGCVPLIKEVNDKFKELLPERWEGQLKYAQKTHPDFVIPETVFTTVTLNKNFRTAGHRDAGDLPDGFGCIICVRYGKFNGGELIFPRYRAAVKFDTFDLVLFDPHEVHANAPIIPQTEDYERITAVFYYREKMMYCGSNEHELARAKSGLRTVKDD